MIKRFQALGRLKKGQMNATERQYAAILDLQLKTGEILWWRFEAIKLRISDNCFYEPDFLVLTKDNELEIREVKGGFITDDAKVKLRACAELFPFRIIMKQYKNKQWTTTEF